MNAIKEFPMDHWIRQYADQCKVHFHGSSAAVLSLTELQNLTPEKKVIFNPDLKLDYGPFEGSQELRSRIAAAHANGEGQLDGSNVIVTPGSIMANYLLLQTICKPNDHVICQYPVYPQLYLVPQASSVDVTLWAMKEELGWLPDINELAGLVRPNTKAIILNNPNNPIGSVLSTELLKQIVDIARKHDIIVISDEVFRPMFHTKDHPSSIVSLGYENTIATGSLSKAYGIPGIRVGWAISPSQDLLRALLTARDYTTIAVSQLDDAVAAYVLDKDVRPILINRNLSLCQQGIELIDDFVNRNKRCRWTRPEAGSTGFVQFLDISGQPLDDTAFCAQVAADIELLLIPCSHCFKSDGTQDFRGYCRFPLGDPDKLRVGLPLLEEYLQRDLQ